jgi:hypothetical protein
MKSEGNLITDWLEQNGDPHIQRFIDINLTLCEDIQTALLEKSWDIKTLSQKSGIPETDLLNWLTGFYNFSLKDLVKIEIALNINLIK